MKICIINNIYPPYDRGGAEQVVVRTVEGLRDAGHEVFVITGSPHGDEIETVRNIKLYRTRPRNIFFYTDAHHHRAVTRLLWHMIDLFNVSSERRVRDILIEEKPDMVHTHNLMGLSFLIPRVIRKLGLRHIHTVHDVQLVEPSAMILKEKEHSIRYNGLHTALYSAIVRFLMGSPDVVISPSHFLKKFYSARGFFRDSRFEIVRNPMTFESSEHPSSYSESAKGERTGFHFLYLGQIEYHKGILLLMQAFRELENGMAEQVTLHIVGDGSKFDEVKKMAGESRSIIVYGRKDRSELPGLFSRVDMTIVPSLCYENSPTVIFESFAFGIPVLASDSEGIEELIIENENGLMFEVGKVHSLKQKMEWCAYHKEAVVGMARKTSRSVQGLSQAEYITRLEKLYSAQNSSRTLI